MTSRVPLRAEGSELEDFSDIVLIISSIFKFETSPNCIQRRFRLLLHDDIALDPNFPLLHSMPKKRAGKAIESLREKNDAGRLNMALCASQYDGVNISNFAHPGSLNGSATESVGRADMS